MSETASDSALPEPRPMVRGLDPLAAELLTEHRRSNDAMLVEMKRIGDGMPNLKLMHTAAYGVIVFGAIIVLTLIFGVFSLKGVDIPAVTTAVRAIAPIATPPTPGDTDG